MRASEIGAVLVEVLPQVILHAQRCGAALAGQPFTRHLEWGPGLLTIEAGMQVAATVFGRGP